MKQHISRFLILALVLGLILPLLPAKSMAVEETQVTVTKTSIQADSVTNEEGYGSLTQNAVFGSSDPGSLGGGDIPPTYALINSDGEFIFNYRDFPCGYSLCNGLFVNGIVTEQYGTNAYGVYSLFDLSGKQVIDQTYNYLNFYNGYGVGIGEVYVENEGDGATSGGVVLTRELIDSQGNTILTLPYGFNLELMGGWGAWMFEMQDWGTGYLGSIGGYGDGLMWVYTGMDIESNISEAADQEWAEQQYESVCEQMEQFGGPFCGYMDLTGKIVIPIQYYSAAPFSEGLAAVQEYVAPSVPMDQLPWDTNLGGAWKYIDKTGKAVFSETYTAASNFSNGYAYVANSDNKYGYIDKSGKTVIPMMYDSAFGSGDGKLFTVGSASGDVIRYGLVDKNNNVVVPLEFDDISAFRKGVAYAIKDRELYIIKESASPAPENPFTDVPSGAYFAKSVQWAVDQGITSGTSATTFSPNKPCTRAQAITFLWNACGKPEPKSYQNPFTDVNSGDYYYKPVLWAVGEGITTGVTDTRFGSKETITRAQLVTILWNAMGSPAVSVSNPFSDIPAGKYYTQPVLWALENGVTSGKSETLFAPKDPCTRAQIVTFLYKLYA